MWINPIFEIVVDFIMQQTISILLVDDDKRVRSVLTEILTPRFKCSSAESASEAVALIESNPFHLALVDLGLPRLSAISLCRLITNRSPHTAIVVIVSKADAHSLAEAMKAGAADHIVRPFSLSQVLMVVERALGRNLPEAVA